MTTAGSRTVRPTCVGRDDLSLRGRNKCANDYCPPALLTGMSGTGKSTLIGALAARGYKAVDTNAERWCE